MNATEIGDITEAMVLAALLESGATILAPFGNSHRYDLVVEKDGNFLRVQCKTGRLKNGAIQAKACSIQNPHLGGRSKDYLGQAELFGIYCPETHGVYLVPVDGSPTNTISLRLEPTRNRQAKGIRWAKDYKVERR